VARLRSVPVPESAETSLQLKEVPTANTERYDSLRGMDATQEISHA
jgi:hypothetical protein